VVVAVVAQPRRLAVERDGPQIRAWIHVLVALKLVGDERQRGAVRSPGNAADVDAGLGELLRVAALAGDDEQFLGRRRRRIARIGEIAALIEPVLDPLVGLALEPLVDHFLAVRRVGRRLRLGDLFRERDPLIVWTENRRALDALDVLGGGIQPVRAHEPDRSTLIVCRRAPPPSSEGEELSVRTPARPRHVQRRIRDAARRRAAVGGDDPELALPAILGLDDRGPDEGHPLAIGRHGRRLDRDDSVVVLERERPGVNTRGLQRNRQSPHEDCRRQQAWSRHIDLQSGFY
jgi:hypothetical protein